MTSFDQRPNRLPAIAATVLAQLAVLLVLCWAAVLYLNWSSDSAMAEFIAATKAPAAAISAARAPCPCNIAMCALGRRTDSKWN